MDYTGLIYAGIVGVAYAVVARRRPGVAPKALKAGMKQLGSILPTFLAIFGIVGLFEIFVPPAIIERYMGAGAGLQSLLIGAGFGALAAGPPPAAFPLAATLLKGGAWLPAIAAFIVAWILVGIAAMPFEAELFGWKFAATRMALSFVAAMLIGLAVGWVL